MSNTLVPSFPRFSFQITNLSKLLDRARATAEKNLQSMELQSVIEKHQFEAESRRLSDELHHTVTANRRLTDQLNAQLMANETYRKATELEVGKHHTYP